MVTPNVDCHPIYDRLHLLRNHRVYQPRTYHLPFRAQIHRILPSTRLREPADPGTKGFFKSKGFHGCVKDWTPKISKLENNLRPAPFRPSVSLCGLWSSPNLPKVTANSAMNILDGSKRMHNAYLVAFFAFIFSPLTS